MKKFLACFLSLALTLQGCAIRPSSSTNESDSASSSESESQVEESAQTQETEQTITSMSDSTLTDYVHDAVYDGVISGLDSEDYLVENVETTYVSQEYIDQLAYNSQENIYFGYKLSDIDAKYEGTRYIFTLGEDGKTQVAPYEPSENYDTTFDTTIQNVAMGTGVILVCVTVSSLTATTAPVVSVIFAIAAKRAVKTAVIGGGSAAIIAAAVEGIQTGSFDGALKAAESAGSDNFKWGAIVGAISGSAREAFDLFFYSKLTNLPVPDLAKIQQETHWSLDMISNITSMDEYLIYREAGLGVGSEKLIDLGKDFEIATKDGGTVTLRELDTLLPDINWNYVDEYGVSNLERALAGKAPIDATTGEAFEIHHIAQDWDSFAVLDWVHHRGSGIYSILHPFGDEGNVLDHGSQWEDLAKAFWESVGNMAQAGEL